jgi:hypothetical protein
MIKFALVAIAAVILPFAVSAHVSVPNVQPAASNVVKVQGKDPQLQICQQKCGRGRPDSKACWQADDCKRFAR